MIERLDLGQQNTDEEKRDVLIAISVIAKRLANKLEKQMKTEVNDDE